MKNIKKIKKLSFQKRIFRQKSLAVFVIIFAVLGVYTLTQSDASRDPYYRPFSSSSIWNMPIGSNAVYVSSGYPLYTANEVDAVHIVRTTASDPIKDTRAPYAWRDRCNLASLPRNKKLHVPNNFVVPDAILRSNGSWATPNNPGIIIQPDGRTIANIATLCREDVGGEVWGWYVNDTDLYGDGVLGSHGASRMSALGGAIRPGELTNDTPIQHALDLILYTKYASTTNGMCYRWPATGCDAYAAASHPSNNGRYQHNVPEMMIGSLLAIPPNVTPANLNITTKAGLKMFYAMQNYGGYFTEDSAWDANYIGIDSNATADISAFRATATRQEVGRIIAAAKVINNNSPNNIGGGGTRRAPLLPALILPGTSDTVEPTVSITAPSNGSTLSGIFTLSANASDNVGVARVDFIVNGAVIHSDSTSPYSYSWDSTDAQNGSVTITARAYDAASNNATSNNVSVTVQNSTPPPPPQPVSSIRINAGGPSYTDKAGNLWLADVHFGAGTGGVYSSTSAIASTEDDALYQTERWCPAGYKIPMVNGTYNLALYFAEINPNSGTRVFGMSAEGQSLFTDFNISTVAGGSYTALLRNFNISVTDGELNITFQSNIGCPKISAIAVTKPTLPTPVIDGDINKDSKVDIQDLTILISNWGQSVLANTAGDLNGDDKVDIQDLTILISNWGNPEKIITGP